MKTASEEPDDGDSGQDLIEYALVAGPGRSGRNRLHHCSEELDCNQPSTASATRSPTLSSSDKAYVSVRRQAHISSFLADWV